MYFWLRPRNLRLLHGNQAAAGGAAFKGGSLCSCLEEGGLGWGADLLLSLPARPAQGEEEGSSVGWAGRSHSLSLSFGV